MRKLIAATSAAAALGCGAANAAIIFSEDFTGEAAGGSVLNFTGFDQFTVSQGVVDIISSGGFGITCVGGTGGCVDLDGSTPGTNPTSELTSTAINFLPGFLYTLSFDISGNQRGQPSDTTQVSVSNGVLAAQSVTLASADPFQTNSYQFSVLAPVLASIIFFTPGASDNFGLILDNVRVDAVQIPLPAAAPLLLFGLAGLGAIARRKRS